LEVIIVDRIDLGDLLYIITKDMDTHQKGRFTDKLAQELPGFIRGIAEATKTQEKDILRKKRRDEKKKKIN
jgi:hypothetical protein